MATRYRRPYTEIKEYTRIEGGVVKLVTEQVTKAVKLDDFISSLGTFSGVSTPILPTGCRYFWTRQTNSIFVIERPPQVKQIQWKATASVDSTATAPRWRLAFPYVIFLMQINDTAIGNTQIFYRTAPLLSMQDKVYHTNLANIYPDDRICTGNMRASGNSPAEKAENFITAFWNSNFNTDLPDHFNTDRRRVAQVADLETWQTSSRENPLFPLEINWREKGTIEDSIKGIIG